QLNPDWIELPSGLLHGISATTIAVWIRDLSPARDGGRLFDFATSSRDEFYFSPVDENPSTTTQGCHLAGTADGSVFVDLWTTTPITNGLAGKWQHVAVSWNAGSVDLYVDGVSVGTKSTPGVLPSHYGEATTNWLGRTLNDAYYALYAEFDDFRIYNRALTAAEITRLYQLR
ncbi:MAG TPA: LamG domain-containing protein, partial [Polyangiaceae bacterium]|nr:LamG domain-containing protein [Polyangiaceae bacterium]